ncbi:MAG TPA: hypothetical protein DCZ95_18085 [Verrucomicrobia bacterium]|nr:hypothetical protein [Verrucomicrobiota bacterium]
MKGKIDCKGFLKLMRGKDLKQQVCPFSNGGAWCSDDCPLFGEPRAGLMGPGRVCLDICQGRTLVFGDGDFVDERNKED